MNNAKIFKTEHFNLSHNLSDNTTDDYIIHCHSSFEIYYYIRGNVQYVVEGKQYNLTAHSVLLLPSNIFHGVKIVDSTPYERYALHFTANAIHTALDYQFLSIFKQHSDIFYDNLEEKNYTKYFDDVLDCIDLQSDIKYECADIRLQNILSMFLCMSRERSHISTQHTHTLLADILKYINSNISSDIKLYDLSRIFFVSQQHINATFKKHMGTTVVNYIIRKRMSIAHQLIMQGESAIYASQQVGISDYSSFYKSYKKIYGHSPSDAKKAQFYSS